MEGNINVKHILSLLRKKIWIIIISVIVFSLAFFSYSKFFVTEKYTSQISLYVSNNVVNSEDRIQSSDLVASRYLALDCLVIFKETTFLTELSSRMQGRISPGALNHAISLSLDNNTSVVKVVVKTPDPNFLPIFALSWRTLPTKP